MLQDFLTLFFHVIGRRGRRGRRSDIIFSARSRPAVSDHVLDIVTDECAMSSIQDLIVWRSGLTFINMKRAHQRFREEHQRACEAHERASEASPPSCRQVLRGHRTNGRDQRSIKIITERRTSLKSTALHTNPSRPRHSDSFKQNQNTVRHHRLPCYQSASEQISGGCL
jgi:hypothetical protein